MADIFTKEDKDVAHFESVRDQMVMPRESFRLPIKAKSWGVLERRLDDQNYDSLTQSIKRKDEKIKTELTPLTKVNVETKIDLNDVSITGTDIINIDNNRPIYGDEDSVTSNEDRIKSKTIYTSYKDACLNNIITCGRESIGSKSRHDNAMRPPPRHDNATRPPPVTSE